MPAVPLKSVAVHLRPNDNIAVAAKSIAAGTDVGIDGRTVTVPGPVRMGHKFAVQTIKEGDPVLKYGQIIGFAAGTSRPASTSVHNVKLGKFAAYRLLRRRPLPGRRATTCRTFCGYGRGPAGRTCRTGPGTTSPSSAP